MLAQCLRDRAEDHTRLGELVLEGGDHHTDRKSHPPRRCRRWDAVLAIEAALVVLAAHAGQDLLLLQRNAQSLIGPQQLGIDLGQALRTADPFSAE